jgi:hypothetical protein
VDPLESNQSITKDAGELAKGKIKQYPIEDEIRLRKILGGDIEKGQNLIRKDTTHHQGGEENQIEDAGVQNYMANFPDILRGVVIGDVFDGRRPDPQVQKREVIH